METMKDRAQMQKEILSMIRTHRERIPPDLLAKAQALAEEQLGLHHRSEKVEESISESGTVPYDREAAQKVVAHFLTNFDPDGKFAAKLRESLL